MTKQKFAIDISEFNLDKVGVNLSVGEPGEGRGSESALKMTATQLSVLAKALGAKDGDVEIITGLAGGGDKAASPEGDDGETVEEETLSQNQVTDEQGADESEDGDDAGEEQGADESEDDAGEEQDAEELAGSEDADEIADSEDAEATGDAITDDEYAEAVYADDGQDDDAEDVYADDEYDGEEDGMEVDAGEAYPDDDDGEEADKAEAAMPDAADRNRDIFEDPDIDLNDLEDLEERYLAARLRDGPAPTGNGLLGGLRQSLESALNIGQDGENPQPRTRRGSKNPIVRDLIRRHIRNRGWE